jgi:hypothetical protein
LRSNRNFLKYWFFRCFTHVQLSPWILSKNVR